MPLSHEPSEHPEQAAPQGILEDAPLAAIDLGSNSFHMVLARAVQGELRVLERLGEKVQLAAGLDEHHCLTPEAQERALACLQRFAPFLQGIPNSNIRIVGTNALRAAQNSHEFVPQAEAIFGQSIEIIAGREEARLIYLGVSHTLADNGGQRLVVDIGGGSTEFIIGAKFDPIELESLHMGCVSYMQRFFPEQQISAKNFERAVVAAQSELLNIAKPFKKLGWQQAVGASGTIKAAAQLLLQQGWGDGSITAEGLAKLTKLILKYKHTKDLDFGGLKPERAAVLPAGLAILQAVFVTFDLQQMFYSEGALREGLLYDQIGRNNHEDVRERTVAALMERYTIDKLQAANVEATAEFALQQVREVWGLTPTHLQQKLRWAARLHEMGLAIAHSQFHKHGAYLLQYSDLAGFTKPQQASLAALVRGHRRKFPLSDFRQLNPALQPQYIRLALLLRLAVLLNHSRPEAPIRNFRLKVQAEQITLEFPPEWLADQPLLQADLAQEAEYLAPIGWQLQYH